MRKVETHAVGRHQRAFLRDMLAEPAPQRLMQEMRHRMIGAQPRAPAVVDPHLHHIADTERAIGLVARERPFHPVAEYLNRLTWDRKPRLYELASDVLNTTDVELASPLVARWCIAAVARAFDPGNRPKPYRVPESAPDRTR